MTTTTFTSGNKVTTVVDLTSGLGSRTTEEILALTKEGAVKEYSEVLPDGRTITYSLEVEEELFEEEEDIEIVSSKTVTSCTLHNGAGIVGTARNIQQGEEITVKKTNSRTVSREEGVMVDIIRSEEKEGGSTIFVEYLKGDTRDNSDYGTLWNNDNCDLENSDKNNGNGESLTNKKRENIDQNPKPRYPSNYRKTDRITTPETEVREEVNPEKAVKPVTVVTENGVLVTCL